MVGMRNLSQGVALMVEMEEKEGRRGRAAYDMDPDLDAIRRAFPMNAAAAARNAAAARARVLKNLRKFPPLAEAILQ